MDTQERPRRRSSDQILDGWTWGRAGKVFGTIATVGGVIFAVATATLTVVVTKPELRAINDTIRAISFRDSVRVNARIDSMADWQTSIAAAVKLIVPLARVSCYTLERDKSNSVYVQSRLPCDTLIH